MKLTSPHEYTEYFYKLPVKYFVPMDTVEEADFF